MVRRQLLLDTCVLLFELGKHEAKIIHQILNGASWTRKPYCIYTPALRIGCQDLLEGVATNLPYQSRSCTVRGNHKSIPARAPDWVFEFRDRTKTPTIEAGLGNDHKAVIYRTTGGPSEKSRQAVIARRSVWIVSDASAVHFV